MITQSLPFRTQVATEMLAILRCMTLGDSVSWVFLVVQGSRADAPALKLHVPVLPIEPVRFCQKWLERQNMIFLCRCWAKLCFAFSALHFAIKVMLLFRFSGTAISLKAICALQTVLILAPCLPWSAFDLFISCSPLFLLWHNYIRQASL